MPSAFHQTFVGIGAIVVGLVMAVGATAIPAEAGYSGVGPNALPWGVAAVLTLCGAWLVWEARTGGFRQMEPPSGAARADWLSAAWVVGAVVANAALITTIGFVLACTLCFVLAVRGLRRAEGKANGGGRQIMLDALTGVLIAAPVFWLFNKLLALNLPAITAGGWI
nr:tripartite tricarboxylate transporter TctB family protein [Roseateles aquatilis]